MAAFFTVGPYKSVIKDTTMQVGAECLVNTTRVVDADD